VHDDGYVLQIRDDSSHYYDLTAAKISSYQAEGLILKDLGKQWPQQHPQFNCQEISTFTVNGMNSFGMTWEFTTRDRKPLFVSGAKSILIHPPGKLQGVRIDQYGTWVDPGLKSAGDVGTNDDLAAILRTFRFL
jgi:hypothetical protein